MTEETTPNITVRLMNFASLAPRIGYGKLASFDASINGIITVRGLHYHRSEAGEYKLQTPRLEKLEAFSVEMPKWMRRKICRAARKVLFALGELPENETADETDEAAEKSVAPDIAVAKAAKPRAVTVTQRITGPDHPIEDLSAGLRRTIKSNWMTGAAA